MDNKEIKIIEIIDKNKDLSQREIAKEANLSLGVVNTLIKTCVKKGLIKIERLNSRNIRYLLTPKGINEKARKTFNYVKRSYGTIMKLRNYFEKIKDDIGENRVFLSEMDKEMKVVITMILGDLEIQVYDDSKDFDIKENDILINWNENKNEKNKQIVISDII